MPDTDLASQVTEPVDTGAPAATPDLTTPAIDATPAAPSPALPADTSPGAKTDPLTTDIRSQNSQPIADPAAAPVENTDWKKRYGDAQAYSQRLNDQVKAMQTQLEPWNGLDPRQVREMVEQQRKAAAQSNLKQWHPQHPEFSRSESRLQNVKRFIAASQVVPPGLPDEAVKAWKNDLAAGMGVTNEDAAFYREHQDHVQTSINEFTRDPDSYIETRTRNAIQRAFREYEQYQSTQTATQQFLTDPKNAPLIQKHADDVLWAMNSPQRRDVGVEFARLKDENEKLRAQIGKQTESVATAEAIRARLPRRQL